MAAPDDYDVVIVGGGPAGGSLACALAGTGLRLAVIEAAASGDAGPPGAGERTVSLACGSRRILAAMGLWQALAARGAVPIRRIHVSDRGRFGFARLDAADVGLEALGYVVTVRALGAVLQERMRSLPGVDYVSPATLASLERQGDGVRVSISHSGQSRVLRARLVVGADGADSAVRRAAGIDAQRRDYAGSAIVATVESALPHGNTAYERFTAAGPLALLPMDGRRLALVWSARRPDVGTVLGWSDTEFRARLQERFGARLGRFTRVGPRRAYPLFLTRVAEPVGPRLVLVGNAAHTVHPVAGQGFNLGLRDVAALADVLGAAARAGADVGDAQGLRRYADARRRDTRVALCFTDGLIRVFANDIAPLAFARNLGLIAVDLVPPLKRALIGISSGLAGRAPRLARGLMP